jgi:hypothetical protein
MNARPVDRCDINHEFGIPTYRVCFWNGAHASWYELVAPGNVRQAIAWADENAGSDRTYTLYAVIDMPPPGEAEIEIATRRAMVPLFGVDPTKNPEGQVRWPSEI